MGHERDCFLSRFSAAECSSRWASSGARRRLWTIRVCSFLFCVSASFPAAHAQETADFFRDRCTSCHTIGGGILTGPDLKNVTKRKDRKWLVDFIMNPQRVIDSGDPYALKLKEKARGQVMAPIAGMTRQRAERLLDLIEAESALEESQFKGLQISSAPFTRTDRELGKSLFFGYTQLENGAPPCISCHSIHGVPALGGGQLGPEQTKVFERLNGRQSLSGWLGMPATETMRPLFQERPLTSGEIHALVAFFAASAAEDESRSTASQIGFLLLGLAGATALVFGCDAIWKFRFHSVRRPLVDTTP